MYFKSLIWQVGRQVYAIEICSKFICNIFLIKEMSVNIMV